MRASADLIVTVCDPAGYVMPGVDVALVRQDRQPIHQTNTRYYCTRSDGKAIWESLAPGAYLLAVKLDGHSDTYPIELRAEDKLSRTVVFETRPRTKQDPPQDDLLQTLKGIAELLAEVIRKMSDDKKGE